MSDSGCDGAGANCIDAVPERVLKGDRTDARCRLQEVRAAYENVDARFQREESQLRSRPRLPSKPAVRVAVTGTHGSQFWSSFH